MLVTRHSRTRILWYHGNWYQVRVNFEWPLSHCNNIINDPWRNFLPEGMPLPAHMACALSPPELDNWNSYCRGVTNNNLIDAVISFLSVVVSLVHGALIRCPPKNANHRFVLVEVSGALRYLIPFH